MHIRGLVKAMSNAGHQVRILGPKGVDSIGLQMKQTKGQFGSWFARNAPELVFEVGEVIYDRLLRNRLDGVIRQFKPDLIYERYAFFGQAGSVLAKSCGIPHFLEVNYTVDDPLIRKRTPLLLPLARKVEERVFSQASVLSVVTSKLRERVRARGADPERVALTPNAVDHDFWKEAPNVIPAPLPPSFAGKIVLGYVGGFYPWHGLHLLIKAVMKLQNAGFQISLLLVGDGPIVLNIKQHIAEAGLLAHLPGTQPHRRLSSWISSMDICVLPHSNDYCSPMKIFEYMACGKPIIAPDLPPAADVITSGVEGLLFVPGDVEMLAQRIEELIRNRDLRLALGLRAREAVAERHTWDKNLMRLFEVGGVDSASRKCALC